MGDSIKIFISHAGEDKDEVARPLAEMFKKDGFSVWYDEYRIGVGDSIPREIDSGIKECDYGIVILSKNYFQKEWPKRELDGLVAKEVSSERILILPIWHGLDQRDVQQYSPTLGSRYGVSTSQGIPYIHDEILKVIKGINKGKQVDIEALKHSQENLVYSFTSSYVWEKFFDAIHSLTRDLPIKERLINAYNLNLMLLREEDLPEDILDDFRELFTSLTKVEPVANEGSVTASVEVMSEGEVRGCVTSIISMYDRVTRRKGFHG